MARDDIDIGAAAAELLRRRRATESLHEFVRQAWPQVEGGREFVDGWMLSALSDHLEAVFRGQIRNLVVNVPPRMAKSLMSNVFWPTWCWLHAPETQFLFTSYSAALTIRDNVRARRIMESQWFNTRWGDRFSLAGDQNTKLRIDNDKGGYRVTTSIDGTTTGEGADIIVCLPAWEIIHTANGPMQIGDLVKRRRDVAVLAFDHKDNQVTWGEIVEWEENVPRNFIEIETEGGDKLTVTEDHLVWTQNRGYVQAKDLLQTDVLLGL